MEIPGERQTYCVYCEAGQDSRVMRRLERLGYRSFSFLQVKRCADQQKQTVRKTPLLPRYVFFEAETEPDWYAIRAVPHIQRILEYGDGARALRTTDLEFVTWMKNMEGLLDLSKVLQAGTRIRVVAGPLKQYEGSIVEVKKRRGVVGIKIGEGGYFSKIWCPVEYVEQAD